MPQEDYSTTQKKPNRDCECKWNRIDREWVRELETDIERKWNGHGTDTELVKNGNGNMREMATEWILSSIAC